MKRIAIGALVAMILALSANPVQAKYPRAGRGVAGTVISVADRYFMFQAKQGTIKVFVSANTNFQVRGQAATAADVKPGSTVRVTAHVTADAIWEAYKVNVINENNSGEN